MADTLPKSGLAGSVAAFFAGLCCVLPIGLMLLGLGGSWLAVFGKVAAISPYVAAVSVLLLGAGWFIALRNNANSRTRMILGVSTALTVTGIVLILKEAAINDYLISLM